MMEREADWAEGAAAGSPAEAEVSPARLAGAGLGAVPAEAESTVPLKREVEALRREGALVI